MTSPIKGTTIEACARAAHEANRAYCILLGDDSQVPWEEADDGIRASALNGVLGVLVEGNGPRESHATWLESKRLDGWVHGAVKDAAAKTHPCMVPYEDLPQAQRAKDVLFVTVVRALAAASRDA